MTVFESLMTKRNKLASEDITKRWNAFERLVKNQSHVAKIQKEPKLGDIRNR